jgi:hypothetical protein
VAQLEQDGDLRGLVRVLEDASTDGATKANAARALGNLAAANANYKVAVATAGAIPLLVELLRGGSDEGKKNATGTLWKLAVGNASNAAVIVLADAIPPMEDMVRSRGSAKGKKFAAMALSNLTTEHCSLVRLRQRQLPGYTQD